MSSVVLTMKEQLLGAAKAVAAAVLPIIAGFITEAVSDLEVMLPAVIAAALNALTVYLIPNKS